MVVYWLEQSKEDVPRENDWLSPGETLVLSRLRFASRRDDWRLGRWTAKRALSACFGSSAFGPMLAKIEVRAAASGAPEVLLEGAHAPVTISLSHRSCRALCAVSRPGVDLGCDLELVEPRSDAFVADYFTAEEQALVARQSATRSGVIALLWSAKESALKALHAGLRLDTRCVAVDLLDGSFVAGPWRPLSVTHAGGQLFGGWWQIADAIVRTIVALPAPEPPVPLEVGDFPREIPFPWSSALRPAKRDSSLRSDG